MDLIGLLRKFFGARDHGDVAADIAARCRSAAWERVRGKAQGMSLAEARGYVRVRVSHLVREEVDAAIRQARLAPTLRTHLEEMADCARAESSLPFGQDHRNVIQRRSELINAQRR